MRTSIEKSLSEQTQKPIRKITKVVQTKTGCLEYVGSLLPNGYAKIGRNGKTYLGHRLAWILSGKDLPDGACVLHKCDNRKCLNPDHLFIGDRFDNMRDMLKKGRHKTNPRRGEENHNAKLTTNDVWKIVRMRGNGIPRKEIAAAIGVSVQAIDHVIYGQTWKHITLNRTNYAAN